MQTWTRAILLALTTVAALIAGGLSPAAAERVAFSDPADMGGASLNDMRRVVVNHGAGRLSVQIRDGSSGAILASGESMRPSLQRKSPAGMVEEVLTEIWKK